MTNRKPAPQPLLTSLQDVSREAHRYPLGRIAAAGLGALTPLMALANPTGGQVVAGSATISNPGANRTLIDQSSQQAIINWQQFSVGAHQFVQFLQPNSSSVVLNRVVGGNMSRIFGDITSNGQVFLINPNGILFGKGATLDMSGLVASTFGISDQDFMQGNYAFTRAPNAPEGMVISQGNIMANRGGYVVLAGDYVENDGHIQALSGKVYLAAGNGATLTLDNNQLISYAVDGATLARLAGAVNAGSIVATGGAVYMTGDVADALTATAVNNQGFISARSIENHSGTIVLSAKGGELLNSGKLDASGVAGTNSTPGGTIVIRGDELTRLAPGSVINAGGNGNGGFIDLSGHDLAIHGQVSPGKGGRLLLDPSVILIEASGSANASNCSGCEGGVIHSNFIQHELNSGVNLTIIASNQIVIGSGNHGAGPATNITSHPTGAGGNLSLRIGHGSGTIGGSLHRITSSIYSNHGTSSGGRFVPMSGGTIDLTGLTISIKGQFVASASQGHVTLGNVTAADVSVTGRTINVDNITAVHGQVTLATRGTTSSHSTGVTQAPGTTIKARAIDVGMSASYGGAITLANLTASSAAAPATINVHARTGQRGNAPIVINGNIIVSGKAPTALSNSLDQFDLPAAAELLIKSSGSGAGVHSVKVNGSINVTAHAAAYSAHSSNESQPVKPRLQSGIGGQALTFITAVGANGAASVTGDITSKGPDAFVGVEAHSVTVHNITVTGSGHNVSRSVVPRPSHASTSYTSHNSAGQASLVLGEVGTTSAAALVKAGNITVSGKGVAQVGLFATQVSAGNITVTATAAKATLKQFGNVGANSCSGSLCGNANSSSFYRGIARGPMLNGSIDAGRADINIDARNQGSGSGSPAVSIKVGTLAAAGVGQARIDLSGKTIQTQGITVVATKGTEKGAGSSVSGANNSNHFVHTFDINGGEADIKIRSGNSGSKSSGVLTQNGGPVTISGNLSATGPTANVDIKGKTVKVGGTLTLTGSGGSITSDTVFTPLTGTGYHTHIVGSEPTSMNLQGGASGSVSVAGKTTIKAPGLVGAIFVGGNVTLHGLSGSASAVNNYSVLDTRVSATTQNLTLGSFGLIVADVKAVGGVPAFTSASNVGDITIKAKGDVDLASQIKLSGKLNVRAAGNIIGSSNGLVGHFNAIQNTRPHANSHSGGGPSPGVLPHLSADASAIAMVAGKNIDLTGTQLTIGTGTFTSIGSDPLLLAGLAGAGLAPLSSSPNGAFEAGGTLVMGGIKMTGSYLLLQGTLVSVLGPVSVPARGFLVQVSPTDPTTAIDIEDHPAASAGNAFITNAVNTSFFLSNLGFLSLFPGDTVAVGSAQESGAVTVGASGAFDIGSTNLIIESSGAITGLSTVTSTGLVVSLLSILGPPIPPVTAGEIDPTTSTGLGDQTDKKHFGQNGVSGDGQQGGTISNDDTGTGVCH